jgi:pyrroline-5-carboxylate reductase
MNPDKQILLVGFGNMGQALARGWIAQGQPSTSIHVADPAPAAREQAQRVGAVAGADCRAACGADRIDVVVLAVKPAQLAAALPQCRALRGANGRADPVFLSIVAGKTIGEIASALGAASPVVRAMPNTPAAIGKGMTVLTASSAVTAEQRALCTDLMSAVGVVAWLENERQMDVVTAVSGSGPAYVFLLIECLEQAAIEMGIDAELARRLATVTVAGAGAYAAASAEDAATLRRRVTSPGGTTQAALDVLMGENGLDSLLSRAVRAATERGRQLATE